MRILALLIFVAAFSVAVAAQDWHKMSEGELKAAVPEKAPVIKENIETEFRTASGITNGRSTIFGVVIITAGYEADGKYTHFLRSGADMTLGPLDLSAGDYIFGYRRLDAENLRVTFYHARTGEIVGEIKATVEQKKGGIYSFLITAPIEKAGTIYIGRFKFGYVLK
jgi:hypothetical protein